MDKLVLKAIRHTMDMSVGNHIEEYSSFDIGTLKPGQELEVRQMPDAGHTTVVDIGKESIVVDWMGHKHTVPRSGEKICTEAIAQGNPYLSRDEISMVFYIGTPPAPWQLDEAVELFIQINDAESGRPSKAEGHVQLLKQRTLNLLDYCIKKEGCGTAWTLLALCRTADDWGKLEVRQEEYLELMDKGMAMGYLDSAEETVWASILLAIANNDGLFVVTDYERLYDCAATAAEAGCENAREVMDFIWPPEQEMEED
ncbi:MAG: hypothetical protein ACI350_10525 [Prevotella sp.]